MKGLHDAYSFLTTVCDDSILRTVTQQVHDIDERWLVVLRALADQSECQYKAGAQHVSRWCDSVEAELCRRITADYDDLNAQHSVLRVSLVCSLS